MKPSSIRFVPLPGFTTVSVLSLAILVTSPTGAEPQSVQQEQFWAERISQHIDNKQIAWLEEANAGKFLSLYQRDNSGHQQGAAVILHEAGTHPAWPEVVDPLRRMLPEHGWSTLSLQIPAQGETPEAIEPSALDAKVAGRITTAIGFLNDKGITNIVLIGYGLGAQLALNFVEQYPEAGIKALISISPHDKGIAEQANSQPSFKTAMLDIYAERDLPIVLKTVADHSLAARRAGLARTSDASPLEKGSYRLLLISTADHGFRGYEDPLVKHLLGWLKRHAPGSSIVRHS